MRSLPCLLLLLSLVVSGLCPPALAREPAGNDAAAGTKAAAGLDDFAAFEDEFGEQAAEEGSPRVFDPLRGYNRVMFKVNDKFYYWLAKPVATGYGKVFPKFFRVSVRKGFHNILFPVRFVNCLLQFKLRGAGTELGRFVVNSTVGLGGLFDPAGAWLEWYPIEEDFGQTLGRYGVGEGFPLVLPVFGPSNLRDALSLVPAYFLNPVPYLADFTVSASVATGERMNYLSLHLGEYETLKRDALDPYTLLRDVYKQNRDKKIKE